MTASIMVVVCLLAHAAGGTIVTLEREGVVEVVTMNNRIQAVLSC